MEKEKNKMVKTGDENPVNRTSTNEIRAIDMKVVHKANEDVEFKVLYENRKSITFCLEYMNRKEEDFD